VIAFEPLRPADLPLLREWLQREHVRRWWDDPEESLAHCEQALAGRDPTAYYLIVVDDRPLGIIQTYLVADNPEWAAIVGPEDGAAGVDLLIGEERAMGRGLGPRGLESFVREVVFATRRRPRASRRSTPRIAVPGGRSRRPASATYVTSRRTASHTA
jgi:aminoglycoside 6'-N-acetyltransferase